MGTSSQVCLETEDGPLYFYKHYDGRRVMVDVQKALSMKLRWDDSHYLARIIFEQMISENTDKECGYGIGLREMPNISLLVIVDCERKEVTVKKNTLKFKMSFDQYIKAEVIEGDIIFHTQESASEPPPG
jgi:hypothetical protein